MKSGAIGVSRQRANSVVLLRAHSIGIEPKLLEPRRRIFDHDRWSTQIGELWDLSIEHLGKQVAIDAPMLGGSSIVRVPGEDMDDSNPAL